MATTINIAFRGLMIFNYQRDHMEIGFINGLPSAGGHNGHEGPNGQPAAEHDHAVHVPRILTMKDGLLASIFDLRTRENELDKIRNWEIEVTDPDASPATVFTVGEDFDRLADFPPDARDFRWIADLEARDLHGRRLSRELDTRRLLLVLYVRHGQFFTKMKSPSLRKVRVDGTVDPVPFGCTAAVTGCDITFNTGEVRLVAGGRDGTVVFPFAAEANTIYEISNAPPDVPADKPISPDDPGHFHMYYDKLFNRNPRDQFDLIVDADFAPGPDPALCGATLLGQRDDPL